ncbi:MAG: hypothetical protein MJ080_01880 [Clostridia bacterium]|nr:hypothetical protein [Clostridia bacterium]
MLNTMNGLSRIEHEVLSRGEQCSPVRIADGRQRTTDKSPPTKSEILPPPLYQRGGFNMKLDLKGGLFGNCSKSNFLCLPPS